MTRSAPAPERETSSSDAAFPRAFWTANITELFERGAYYAMASFVVIYFGRLGMGRYWPSTLNSMLWSLVYFLPILSGTVADQVGFRKALLGAFVLLTCGYLLMGTPVWFAGATLLDKAGDSVTTTPLVAGVCVGAILLIGVGGSIVKPCISGTVQKTSSGRATLAFAIFYMVINIGSLFGRAASYYVRTHSTLVSIFGVSMTCAILAFAVVAIVYREPARADGAARARKSVGRVLVDMVVVLKSPRFVLFLLVMVGFNFLYSQVYNVLPLYLATVLEKKPAVDLYTMANPLVIVCFQLLVTRRFGRMAPIRSMVVGTVIIGLAMLINVVPLYLTGGPRALGPFGIPVGSLFVVATVALIALGELFAQARVFEYIGALAPKGQEGLFLGYANLPTALGALTGGPVGAYLFHDVICRGATMDETGLLVLDRGNATLGWLVLMSVGFASAGGLWVYHRWVTSTPATPAEAT
jgi:POT family proton-dependent oligopeptide transporter